MDNSKWNELYDDKPLSRLKSFYKNDVIFVLRQLLHQWITQNLPVPNNLVGKHHFMISLVRQLNQCEASPMIRCWIESVRNELIMLDSYFAQIFESFMAEQNSTSTQPLSLSEIDNNILFLRMLKICHKKTFQQFQFQWKLYGSGSNTQLSQNVSEFKMNIVASIKNVIQLTNEVQQKVIQSRNACLSGYERNQNLSNLWLSQLAVIQVWFDEIAEIIWDTRTLINDIRNLDNRCCTAELNDIHKLFKELIGSIMVLENQPFEITTKENNCPSTVRILLKLGKFVDVKKLKLDVAMFSERKSVPSKSKLDIGSSQFQVEENSLTRHLKDLKVEKVERKYKKSYPGDIIAVSEKYILKYSLEFTIDNMKFNAHHSSWPFFVIVNQNQAPLANAALLWDKHFPSVDRSNAKASVPWESMPTFFKMVFNHETGCDLNDLNVEALHEKCSNGIIKNGQFVWSKSCVKMSPSKFTFWDWFFGTTRLIKKCLSEAWQDGLIDGYLNDNISTEQLRNYPDGTFLLRFSDSELSALTPVYIERDENNMPLIKKVTPFSIKEFEIRNRGDDDPMYYGIGNLISPLSDCIRLRNGMSKLEAFAKHSICVCKSREGYVERPDANSVLDTSSSASEFQQSPRFSWPSAQPHSVESEMNYSIASSHICSETFNTVSNATPVSNEFSSHTSNRYSPYQLGSNFSPSSSNFQPSIPFQSSPSLAQSQSVEFENNFTQLDFTGSPSFTSAVPIENTFQFHIEYPSDIPTPCVDHLSNSNSFNVTQVEYNRPVLNTPVPQLHHHNNYYYGAPNNYGTNSNMAPINQFSNDNSPIQSHNTHDYMTSFNNGCDVSMENNWPQI